MNKSAGTVSREEHKAAFWLLNYERFVKKNRTKYDHRKDYYGFIPVKPYRNKNWNIRSIRLNDIDSLTAHYDMAWFVDTYGLSLGDWYGDPSQDVYSRMLYGGLNKNDYIFIKEMLGRNKLVIAEFNFFASPTTGVIRSKTEKLVDVYWSGWTGIYYDNLNYLMNKEVPGWIINNYKEQNQGEWPYSNSGIVLVNHEGKVLVLEYETHIDIEVPLVTTSYDKASSYGVSPVVHYPCRFDISYAADTSDVISYYELSVNLNGERLLSNHNIPSRFPAVTKNSGNGLFYYLAGSYSHHDMTMLTSMLRGSRSFEFIMHSERIGSKGKFFREYYYPFISTVISDYYEIISNQ